MKKNTGSSLFKTKISFFEPLKNMGTKTENSQQRIDFDAHKCALIPLRGIEGGNNFQNSGNNKKNSPKSHLMTP